MAEEIVKVIRIDTGDAENSVSRLTGLIEKLRKELEGLEGLSDKYSTLLKQLADAQECLSGSLNNEVSSVSKATDTFSDLGNVLSRVYNSVKDMNGDGVDRILSLVSQLGNEIDSLSPDGVERLRKEISGLLGDSEKSFASLKRELDELSREWEEAGTDIERSNIAENIKRIKDEMQRMKTDGGLDTVKDLKAHINELRDSLLNIQPETEKYRETVDQLIQAEMRYTTAMRAGKNEVTAALGSYNSLVNEMNALKKVWKEVTDETERSRIAGRINEINTELKRMDATLGNHQRNVGNYTSALQNVTGNTASWRRELKDLKIALQNLDPATREYQEAFARAAQLTHDLAEQQQELKYGSPDLGDKLSNLAGIATDVAGGMSAMNALMGLFGSGDEDMQKAMLTATRMIQLVQGLSKIDDLRKRLEGLGKTFKSTKGQAAEYETQIQGIGGASSVAAAGTNTMAGAVNAAAGAAVKSAAEFAEASNQIVKMTASSKGLEGELNALGNEQNKLANDLAILVNQFNSGAISEAEFSAQAAPIKARMEELDASIVDVMHDMHALANATTESTAKMASISPEMMRAAETYGLASEKISEYQAEIDKLNPSIESERARIDELTVTLDYYKNKQQELIATNGEEVKSIAPLATEINSLTEQLQNGQITAEQYSSSMQRLRNQYQGVTGAVNAETAAIRNNNAATVKTISTIKGFREQKRLERAEREKAAEKAKAETAALNGQTTATIRYTGAAKLANIATIGLSKAFTVLKSAIIATGIGAVFVLISKFVNDIGPAFSNMLHRLNKDASDAREKLSLYRKELEALQHQIEGDNRMMNFETQLMQVQGKTEKEVLQVKQRYIKSLMDQMRALQQKQQAEWDDLSLKQQESKKYAEVREQMEKTREALKDLEDQYQEVGEAIILANATALESMKKTDRDAADAMKSAIQLENEAYQKMLKEFQDAGLSTENITRAHWKKIKGLIDAETKSIVDRAKAANQTELQNLDDRYKKELQLLTKYGISTENLTREYVAARQKILDKGAENEYKRYRDTMLKVLTMYDILNAAGVENAEEYRKKLEYEYNVDNEYYEKMKALYRHIIDDETTTVNARKEAEEKLAATVMLQTERWTRFELDNIRRRTAETDKEIERLEEYMDVLEKKDDLEQRSREASAGLFEFGGGSYKDQENAIVERYRKTMDVMLQEEAVYKKVLKSEEASDAEKTAATQKLSKLRQRMMDQEEEKVIELAELTKDKNREVADAMLDVAGSIGDVFGSLADAISAHTQAMIDAGKMTDEQAQKEFKKVKDLQIAQATISMISGAIGAFMQASQTIPPPIGQIVGGAAAAAVLATGAAQIEQIRHTKPGSSSSSVKNVSVTPTYERYQAPTVQNVNGLDDELKLRNALEQARIWVSVSDIDSAQKGRRVKVAESKF